MSTPEQDELTPEQLEERAFQQAIFPKPTTEGDTK